MGKAGGVCPVSDVDNLQIKYLGFSMPGTRCTYHHFLASYSIQDKILQDDFPVSSLKL